MSEILSYEKFVENLRAYLLDALNLQEERIYFKVKDEAGMTPEGDRLFVECNVSPEGKEVCGIHTEELYEDYLDGISIKRIGDTVTDEILKLKDAGFFKKVQDVNNYPKVKGDLFIRLLNKKKHEKALENAVYKEVDGAVAVLYPEVIKKLVELMDGDFYVVFSSVHEALIHSSKLCSLEELENLLRTSNSRMTFQKEFLTDKVYYYCREKDKFIMLQGSLKMLVTTIRMDEEN